MSVLSDGLASVIDNFMFYGDPEAPYWMLGLEEGDVPGSKTPIEFLEKVVHKSQLYEASGSRVSLRDMCGTSLSSFNRHRKPLFIPDSELLALGGYKINLQRTWEGYTKLLFSIWHDEKSEKSVWTQSELKAYQEKSLGQRDLPKKEHASCLLEFFPIPYQRGHGWPYSNVNEIDPELDYLRSDTAYEAHVFKRRMDLFIASLHKHQPKFVFCFGKPTRDILRDTLLESYEVISIPGKNDVREISLGYIGDTCIVFSNHPTDYGMSNAYWINLGSHIRSLSHYRQYQEAS